MEDLTHNIAVTITGSYPHGARQHATVALAGNGGLEHFIEVFKMMLLAGGFSTDLVRKLDELDV